MSDSFSELARKYREEMMRMYSTRKPSMPPPPKPPEPPRPPQPSQPPRPPQPPQPPRPPQPSQPPRPPQPPQPPRPPQPPQPPRPPQLPQPPRPQPRDFLPVNAEPDEPISQPVTEEIPEPVLSEPIMEESSDSDLPEPAIEERPESDLPEPVIEEFPEEDYDDPVLPDYIQPVTPSMPKEWQAQEEYDERNTAEGRLYIVAAAADNAYPVPGATVTIYTRIGDEIQLNYLLTTNESGRTPTVTLPAPPAALSQDPDNHAPYATCNIHIYASGYFQEEAREVPIFAGVTSRQEFQMIPLPLAVPEDADTIVFSESGGV